MTDTNKEALEVMQAVANEAEKMVELAEKAYDQWKALARLMASGDYVSTILHLTDMADVTAKSQSIANAMNAKLATMKHIDPKLWTSGRTAFDRRNFTQWLDTLDQDGLRGAMFDHDQRCQDRQCFERKAIDARIRMNPDASTTQQPEVLH